MVEWARKVLCISDWLEPEPTVVVQMEHDASKRRDLTAPGGETGEEVC